MNTYQPGRSKSEDMAVANSPGKPADSKPAFQLTDNRPRSIMQKKQLEGLDKGGKREGVIQRKANYTGLPDQLKTGIENLSGHSMDDVKVHYNSAKPAQLNAHAYAQGTEIHLASGQEKHLPHEAWHVVQQKQGRVKPTMQMKGKVNINDDKGLEKEADVMGGKALQRHTVKNMTFKTHANGPVAQRVLNTQINAASVPLRPAEQAKLNQVVAYMNVMGAHLVLAINSIQIRILARRDTDPSPAYTWKMVPGNHIIVDMAEWYLRIASVGEITGLIAHEIGVHTLADARMTVLETNQENIQTAAPSSIKVGLHTHTVKPFVLGGRRQKDHVNVVRDTGLGAQPIRPGGGPPALRRNARTRMYVDTMLRLGDAINNAGLHPAERDKQLQDLLGIFLFDYARVLATDDGRAQYVFLKAHLITQVFNWYRSTVIRRYGAAHAWLNSPAVQPNSSGWGLRAYLLTKFSAWVLEQIKSSRAGVAVGHAAQGIARVSAATGARIGRAVPALARAGNYTATAAVGLANTMAWARRAAAIRVRNIARPLAPLGRAAGATLRGADHVYGEVENLGYNVVRGGLNVGKAVLSTGVNVGKSVISTGWNLGKSAVRMITG